MALKDYAIDDEEDFYNQGFEKENFVSIWIGINSDEDDPDELDVLQDLCGVGYYDIDQQDGNCFDFELTSLEVLLEDMSYSKSFVKEAVKVANGKNINNARWVILQYDFAYDPIKVKREISDDPIFLGCFLYEHEEG